MNVLSPAGKQLVKHLVLYGFVAVLGIVCLEMAFTGASISIGSGNIFIDLLSFLFGGTVSLTAGIVGIGRQFCGDYQGLFTLFAVITIPIIIFILVMNWMGAFTIAY